MFSREALTSVTKANPRHKPLLAALALLVSAPASALEYNAATTLTTRHSNNTFLTEDDRENNFSLEPGILLDARHEGPNLNAGIDYQFERRFHTESDNTERNFFTGNAAIDWMILPDRLQFNANQSSTESTFNARQFGAPNDRIVTDNLSAGPTLMFRVRDTDRLRLTYLYEDRNDPIDENDSTTDVLSGSYMFQINGYSSLTAQHREEEIEFKSDLAPDLDVTKQSLSYVYRNQGTSLELVGGYTEFEREGAEPVDGGVGSLTWTKEFGQTTFRLFGTHQITNQSSRLFTELDSTDLNRDFTLFLNTNIAEVFTETNFGFQIDHIVGPNEYSFSATSYRSDFEEFVGDSKSYLVAVGLERLVRRNMTFDIIARYRRYEEDDVPPTLLLPGIIGADTKNFETRATLDWEVASNLNLLIGFEYRNVGSGIAETVTFATATYALFKRNQASRPRTRRPR